MLTMDVFNGDAFTATSLTAAVDKLGHVPTTLSSIPGLIVPVPVRTKAVWIEARASAPALIQTSPRGSAPGQKGGDQRDARAFNTRRLALASRIEAEELQGIRAFGSETELKQLMTEVARRQMKIKRDFALTKEAWLLNVVQGIVKDADGTLIYDWAAEFKQTIPAEVAFNIPAASAPADGSVRKNANQITRTMTRNLLGLGGTDFRVVALCGDDFYDALTTCAEVERTFLNWSQAEALRNETTRAWSAFKFGDILWVNYRGTDDNSTVAVAKDKAKFFPVGAGIFQMAYAPAERFGFVNTLGQEMYSWMVLDKDRDSWADVECYSYPLPVCTMPQALASGRMGP
jgi:hypothetical protein